MLLIKKLLTIMLFNVRLEILYAYSGREQFESYRRITHKPITKQNKAKIQCYDRYKLSLYDDYKF